MDPATVDLIKASALAFLRHGLTTVAGFLVAKGAIENDQSQAFITIVSGIIVWAIGYGWSIYQKKGVVGIKTDLDNIRLHLSKVPTVSAAVPQANAINAAIDIAKKT